MMITLSSCQTLAKTGGFISYDEHYQKNETTLKEDALSDRWESRGSKVAVVSKEKADNNDYPEAKEDRKSTRLNSSHNHRSRMPSSA